MSFSEHGKLSRVVDLDIDIGADAVDYKYVSLFLFKSSFYFQNLVLVLLRTKNRYLPLRPRCASLKAS